MGNRDDILFILQVEDMVVVYDHEHGEGSYDKLNDEDKTDLKAGVKKHLEYGLGEAWAEYMKIAIQEAKQSAPWIPSSLFIDGLSTCVYTCDHEEAK